MLTTAKDQFGTLTSSRLNLTALFLPTATGDLPTPLKVVSGFREPGIAAASGPAGFLAIWLYEIFVGSVALEILKKSLETEALQSSKIYI